MGSWVGREIYGLSGCGEIDGKKWRRKVEMIAR